MEQKLYALCANGFITNTIPKNTFCSIVVIVETNFILCWEEKLESTYHSRNYQKIALKKIPMNLRRDKWQNLDQVQHSEK